MGSVTFLCTFLSNKIHVHPQKSVCKGNTNAQKVQTVRVEYVGTDIKTQKHNYNQL